MSIDALLDRKYDKAKYNCAHFVCDAWQLLFRQNLSEDLASFLLPPNERRATIELRRKFRRIPTPSSPAIAIMHRRRTPPHVGIFYKRKILHLHEYGVQYQTPEIAARGFNHVTFYAYHNY